MFVESTCSIVDFISVERITGEVLAREIKSTINMVLILRNAEGKGTMVPQTCHVLMVFRDVFVLTTPRLHMFIVIPRIKFVQCGSMQFTMHQKHEFYNN